MMKRGSVDFDTVELSGRRMPGLIPSPHKMGTQHHLLDAWTSSHLPQFRIRDML